VLHTFIQPSLFGLPSRAGVVLAEPAQTGGRRRWRGRWGSLPPTKRSVEKSSVEKRSVERVPGIAFSVVGDAEAAAATSAGAADPKTVPAVGDATRANDLVGTSVGARSGACLGVGRCQAFDEGVGLLG
jgi:hypothetical protein